MFIVLMCLYCVCVVILCLCSYTVFVYLYCVCVCVLCSCVYMLFVYLCCVRAVISCLWAAMVARVSFLFRSFGFTWVFACVFRCALDRFGIREVLFRFGFLSVFRLSRGVCGKAHGVGHLLGVFLKKMRLA